VAEKFLDRPQVRACTEKVGGESMSQGVWGGSFGKAETSAKTLYKSLNLPRAQRSPPVGPEQRVVVLQAEGERL
jgi:hypothetical protein